MFSLNTSQKNELWSTLAASADAATAYIKSRLHVKLDGKWVDTSNWQIKDAELAFHRPVTSLSVHLTSHGGVGRCMDWQLAFIELQNLQLQGRHLTPNLAADTLLNAGFTLTGVGDIHQLLNINSFKPTPFDILNMLDKPGFYSLILPQNHPRLKRALNEVQQQEKLKSVGGFRVLKDPELYVEAICATMEQTIKNFETLRDQVHSLLAYNNISLQPANALPVPEDADVWLSSVDPILKKAFDAFTDDSFDLAYDILSSQLHYVYRPMRLASESKTRAPLANLLEKKVRVDAPQNPAPTQAKLRPAMQQILALAQASKIKDIVSSSVFFSLEDKALFMKRWEGLFSLVANSSVEELKQAAALFMDETSEWLNNKASVDFLKFETHVAKSFKSASEIPAWYSTQIQQIHPNSNHLNISNGEWWENLRYISTLCDPRMQAILQAPFEAAKYESVVGELFPNTQTAIQWLSSKGFLDVFKKDVVANEPSSSDPNIPRP